MLTLPDYWLPRPAPEPDDQTRAAFDALLDTTLARGSNAILHYDLPAPKWQFLCHAADRRGLAVHGSGNAEIAEFEPRQAVDRTEFGNRKAVYAAADGLWALYFAIVDRERHAMSLTNGCIRLALPDGTLAGPFYHFSVSQTALIHQPWRNGTVYLLPAATFEAQPPMPFGPAEVRIAQLASLQPVTPLARLAVTPEDFPFLRQIRGHDDERFDEYVAALQSGGPWPEGQAGG